MCAQRKEKKDLLLHKKKKKESNFAELIFAVEEKKRTRFEEKAPKPRNFLPAKISDNKVQQGYVSCSCKFKINGFC